MILWERAASWESASRCLARAVEIEVVSSRVPYRSKANILEGEVMVRWYRSYGYWWGAFVVGGGMEELGGMSHCYMILWMAGAPSVGGEYGIIVALLVGVWGTVLEYQ